MVPRVSSSEVPQGVQIQLARLFGDTSREARASHRTPAAWRITLRKVLRELDGYLEANVDTDDLHRLMLASCLWAAEESLKQEDFWPAYSEAITRFSLLLLSDYPDHRRRKPGRKRDNPCDLTARRTVHYSQSAHPPPDGRCALDATPATGSCWRAPAPGLSPYAQPLDRRGPAWSRQCPHTARARNGLMGGSTTRAARRLAVARTPTGAPWPSASGARNLRSSRTVSRGAVDLRAQSIGPLAGGPPADVTK